MKTVFVLANVSLSLSGRTDVVAGRVVSHANGHIYYLISENSCSNAETDVGAHPVTIRNAAGGFSNSEAQDKN